MHTAHASSACKELTARFDGDQKIKYARCATRAADKVEILSCATIEPVSKFMLRTDQQEPMARGDPSSQSRVWLQSRKTVNSSSHVYAYDDVCSPGVG